MELSVLPNCGGEERFKAWKKSGEALLGNRNLGCGLNALTYLGIFTRRQGEQLVSVVNNRGTSFQDMMNFVFNGNGGTPQYERPIPIRTIEEVREFIRIIKRELCDNCCTVAKLMRYDDNDSNPPSCNGTTYTPGHSIVFSIENGDELWAIDPQQGTRRRSDNAEKAFEAWNNKNCYKWISLMYHIQFRETVPMDIAESASTHAASTPMSFPRNSSMRNIGVSILPNRGSVPMDVVTETASISDDDGAVSMDIDESPRQSRSRSQSRRRSRGGRRSKKITRK